MKFFSKKSETKQVAEESQSIKERSGKEKEPIVLTLSEFKELEGLLNDNNAVYITGSAFPLEKLSDIQERIEHENDWVVSRQEYATLTDRLLKHKYIKFSHPKFLKKHHVKEYFRTVLPYIKSLDLSDSYNRSLVGEFSLTIDEIVRKNFDPKKTPYVTKEFLVDLASFIEHIPTKKTREYKELEEFFVYAKKYFNKYHADDSCEPLEIKELKKRLTKKVTPSQDNKIPYDALEIVDSISHFLKKQTHTIREYSTLAIETQELYDLSKEVLKHFAIEKHIFDLSKKVVIIYNDIYLHKMELYNRINRNKS